MQNVFRKSVVAGAIVIATVLGVIIPAEATARVPKGCRIVLPSADNDHGQFDAYAEGVYRLEYYSFRGVGIWLSKNDHWDAWKIVGFAKYEDSEVWNRAKCLV